MSGSSENWQLQKEGQVTVPVDIHSGSAYSVINHVFRCYSSRISRRCWAGRWPRAEAKLEGS